MVTRVRFEYPVYRWWGMPSRYNQLIDHLNRRQYQAVLGCASDDPYEDELPDWLTPLRPSLRHWVRQGEIPWYTVSALHAEAKAAQSSYLHEVDIIHFMNGDNSAQFLPRRFKEPNAPGVRTVATFHMPLKWASESASREQLRWFDAVILVSHTQVPFYGQHVPADRLHVILHGVDTNFFHPANGVSRSSELRCITTGHHLRDWNTFLKVAQAMPDVRFLVATSSRVKLGELPNVEVHSGISDEQLAALYRSADVLFLPLIDATANNALLEGIASGLPAVTTDIEAVREYLPSNEAFLVRDNSVGGFVSALRNLQGNFELRREMGGQARARAEELAWPRIIHQYEQLYTSLLAREPRQTTTRQETSFDPIKALAGRSREPAIHVVPQTNIPAPEAGAVDLANISTWGYSLIRAGLLADANVLFDGLAATFPKNHHVQAGLAWTAEYRWDWKKAIRHWDQCGSTAPAKCRFEVIARKAHCLTQIGEIGQARTLYSSIANIFEGMEGLARIASLEEPADKAARQWEQCTVKFPGRIEGFLGWASTLLEYADYDRYDTADAMLEHICSVWPESLQAASLRAYCATLARKWSVAEARWNALMERQRDHKPERCLDLYVRYARHLAKTDDQSRMRNCSALLTQDQEVNAIFLREYHRTRDEFDLAAAQARRLVELDGQNLSYRLEYAELLMQAGNAEAASAARRILEDLHAVSPDSVSVKSRLAEAFIRADLIKEAADLMQTIPAADKSILFEILRQWVQHRSTNGATAADLWRILFLDFRILQTSKKLDRRWQAPNLNSLDSTGLLELRAS